MRPNPLFLGAFLCGAVAITVAVILGLGPVSLFHSSDQFIFFLRATHGLSDGAGVDLNGVRVGQVQSIQIYYDRDRRASFVGVICRISRDSLVDLGGRPVPLTERRSLQALIDSGLFAQVQNAGLVGASHVELAFNAPGQPIQWARLPATPYPIVPSLPSTMTELTANLSDIVSNLRKIDFHAIMQQVDGVLGSARGQIAGLETNHLTDHISAAAESIGDLASSSDLRAAVARLQQAAAGFAALSTNLDAQVGPTAKDLDATLAEARKSTQALDDFLNLRNQLGGQTDELLEQLDRTARAIERLSDFLERHPNAIITGRAQQSSPP